VEGRFEHFMGFGSAMQEQINGEALAAYGIDWTEIDSVKDLDMALGELVGTTAEIGVSWNDKGFLNINVHGSRPPAEKAAQASETTPAAPAPTSLRRRPWPPTTRSRSDGDHVRRAAGGHGDTYDDHRRYYRGRRGRGNECRAGSAPRVAETLPPEDVDAGVILIAVPARNWRTGRGTSKAETTRRIRSA
jgi:hypothetical protein